MQIVHYRVANPHKKRVKARRRSTKRRQRRNPLLGGGELALMTNPKRKKKYAKKANRRRNPSIYVANSKGRRRRNSSGFRRRSNRRRNPVIGGYGTMDLLKVGVSAAAGGYGTRALTQMLLQSNNQGWMGYAGNIAIALGLGWAADKFLGKDYGVGVIAGGFSATAVRIWSEKVSQTSPSQLSGLGDLDFSSHGLGDYVASPFPVPTHSVRNTAGQYIAQNPWPPALPAAAPAAGGAKGMGRVPVARFKSRWSA